MNHDWVWCVVSRYSVSLCLIHLQMLGSWLNGALREQHVRWKAPWLARLCPWGLLWGRATAWRISRSWLPAGGRGSSAKHLKLTIIIPSPSLNNHFLWRIQKSREIWYSTKAPRFLKSLPDGKGSLMFFEIPISRRLGLLGSWYSVTRIRLSNAPLTTPPRNSPAKRMQRVSLCVFGYNKATLAGPYKRCWTVSASSFPVCEGICRVWKSWATALWVPKPGRTLHTPKCAIRLTCHLAGESSGWIANCHHAF